MSKEDWIDDVFLEYDTKEGEHVRFCVEEKALSILLAEGLMFANSRNYVEHEWVPDEANPGKYKKTEKYTMEGETIVLFVNCNDLFWWACADSENVTLDEVPELYMAWKKDKSWGISKWCCKKRNMMPQLPIREDMKKEGVWEEWMDKLQDPGPS
jgi:hypothetical protein